jgi:hypothetical protein
MIRVLFEYLLPLILPTALYALWIARQRRQASAAGTPVPGWQDGPWFWLALGGIGLCAAVFVTSALVEGYRPGAQYTPAQIENGKIVPGQFNDPGQSKVKE